MQRSVQTASVRDDHRLSTLDDVATLREKAGAVTEELAATAVARDRAGRLPTEEIALLRRAGLLQLLVPTESGGPGGDWTDAVTLTRVLSRADGSIGQLLGYHYLNAIIVELLGNPIQVAGLRVGLLQEQWFLGDSVNPLDPGLVVERSDDDIVLNGRKTFSTGAAVADRVLVVFMLGETARFAIVPRDRKGLIANDDWENVGQRLTASGSVTFDRVRVGREEVLGTDLNAAATVAARATLVPPLIQSIFVNVQLGIAEGALAAAASYTRETSRPWFKSGVNAASEDSYILAEYGRLSARIAASAALAEVTAKKLQVVLDRGDTLTADERGVAAVQAFGSKVENTDAALEVTAKIFELMGARATAQKFGFDRYWRDVRTLSLHDPVIYKAREVGDYFVNGRIPEVSTYS
jgi:alkylation response protein AidB-like acyl-CoA dehydrogenase